jgi:two-component system, NtrC family, response regulator AlgB
MPDILSNGPYPLNVLVVDDELNIRKTLSYCLESEGHKVVSVSNPADARAEAARRSFDMAFVDLRLGNESGLDLIPELLAASPWMKIVVVTAFATVPDAVQFMKSGSVDYLAKPFKPDDVRHITQKIAEIRRLEENVARLKDTLGRTNPEIDLGASNAPEMQRAFHMAQQVATTDATVLVCGESGTGKGVLVRAIHAWSPRAQKPFGTVSCPSLSAELLESELFGHTKGAFTTAIRDNPGRIAMCEGGTLFLDEIGDLPIPIQPKLLRFLQDREYERVGEQITRRADIRLLTATNVDLDAAVKNGKFREDLLYRLNVITIEIPPLRRRVEDIVPMAERLLAFFAKAYTRKVLGFTPEAQEALRRHQWPGNVRELRNVIERCAILSTKEWIGPEILPGSMAVPAADPVPGAMISLEKLEELHIRRVLATAKHLEEAAEVLGIDAATLWRRRKKYGI